MKVGFAIIGCGEIALKHAEAIESCGNCKLVGAFSRSVERGNEFCKKREIKHFKTMQELLNDSNVQAVSVTTENNSHAFFGVQVARARKHVLVEKPIEVSLEKARELIKACEDNDVILGVVSQRRFDEAFERARQMISENRLGRIETASLLVRWRRDKDYFENREWRKDLKIAGGGVLIMQAIHSLDCLLWILGKPVREVTALKVCRRGLTVEDSISSVIRLDSDILVSLNATLNVPLTFPDRIEIQGSERAILIEDYTLSELKKPVPKKIDKVLRIEKKPKRLRMWNFKDIFNDFAKAVNKRGKPRSTGIDGLELLKVILAIYESAETGKTVKVN